MPLAGFLCWLLGLSKGRVFKAVNFKNRDTRRKLLNCNFFQMINSQSIYTVFINPPNLAIPLIL